VGGGLSAVAVAATVTGAVSSGWPAALLAQPAAWTVPTAFAVMVVGSLLTRGSVPADVGRTMLLLHAPDGLGLRADPGDADRSSRATTAQRSRTAVRRNPG
jgi:hypothetical protein